jgi:hypothetical protein
MTLVTETILFADDVMQVQQEQITGSRSKFEIRNLIIPSFPTNIQLDSQRPNSQFQFDNDEIDNDDIPKLINQESEQMMGS